MLFADDSQIYVVCRKPSEVVGSLALCIEDIREWMNSNLLVLNDNKSEVVQFTSKLKRDGEKLDMFRIGNYDIIPTDTVRNLGVLFQSDGGYSNQINAICKSAYYSLYRIGKIRSLLDQSCTEKLVHAFITSKIDYCNSLFIGLPEYELEKIQSVQNSAARLVSRSRKYDHLSPIYFNLHWLRVNQRIDFKVILTVLKIVHNQSPVYL